MNKKALIALIIFFTLAVGGYLFFKNRSAKPIITQDIITGEEAAKLFTYQGKLVHPSCLDFQRNGAEGENIINFDSCMNEQIVSSQDNGFLEAEYLPDQEFPSQSTGYAEYKVLAKKGDTFLIFLQTSGGGTGIFSSIFWVKMEKDKIYMVSNVIGEGDRCNGGLYAELSGKTLKIYENVTPIDIVDLVASSTLKAYKDLESSASSCFGTAYYNYDIAQNQLILSLVSLNNETIEDQMGWTGQYTYQTCFNKVYNEYVQKKKIDFTLEELKAFVNIFFTKCNIKNL